MIISALIIACSALTAFSSMLQELSLAQTLSATLGGTALRYATTIALFTFSLGIGSWIAEILSKKKNTLRLLLISQLLLTFIGAASPWLIRFADPVSGHSVPGLLLVSASYLPILAVGVISGAELPLLMRFPFCDSGTVLAFDYLGMVLACLVFPLALLPALGVFGASAVAASINLLVFILLLLGSSNPLLRESVPQAAPETVGDKAAEWPGIYVSLFVIFIVSACGMGYEIIIARGVTNLIHDDVISQSISIGVFLLGMACGAWLCRKVKLRSPIATLLKLEILLAVLGSLCVTLILFQASAIDLLGWARFQRLLLSPGLKSILPILVFEWGAFLIGALCGAELPLLIKNPVFEESRSYGNALGWSYCGSLLGGFLVPLWIIPSFGLRNSGALVSLGNLLACLVLLNPLSGGIPRIAKQWKRWLAVCVATYAIAIGLRSGPWVEQLFLKTTYLGLRLNPVSTKSVSTIFKLLRSSGDIQRIETPYQSIDLFDSNVLRIGGIDNDFRLYLNRQPQFFSAGWRPYHEAFAFGSVNLARHVPKKVLILGGGDGILAGQLLNYPEIQSIELIEIDPEMIRLARDYPEMRMLNEGSLDNPRVHVRIDDAFQFVRSNDAQYDAVFVDFPYPVNFDLARVFSIEFYRALMDRIAPGGFVVMDAPLWRDFENPDLARTRSSEVIFNTIHAAGFETIFPFGPLDPLIYLEKGHRSVSFDYARLSKLVSNDGFVNFLDITDETVDERPGHGEINSVFKPWRFAQ